jgi:hypothetical protein
MSHHVTVNFKIVGINSNYGVMYVNFWADGATQERFGSDIGPYEVPMTPDCVTMTEEQLAQYVAKFGVPIVERQQNAIDVENLGVDNLFQNMLNIDNTQTITIQEVTVDVPANTTVTTTP